VISAGATLDELYEVYKGSYYSGKFLAMVLAWHGIKMQIGLHQSDAQATAVEKDMKRKR
jgi:hypothetical protein